MADVVLTFIMVEATSVEFTLTKRSILIEPQKNLKNQNIMACNIF
jgi:hypothetical protein